MPQSVSLSYQLIIATHYQGYNISGKPAIKLQRTSSHIFSGRSLPNALIEEPKESNARKGKPEKHYIYNNYSMKAIHLNEFLTCIHKIITTLSKYRSKLLK
ncbi:hypothetical protein [Photorhabdus bodei]|uniref:Uncharacterized protein n=1 Tax=Photorhabdus bodei TaxID=2029681 RepID=A0ABX0AJ89_9GAMM|nr:hypothetical protein [Photorhabdus bodei]NDK99966.1 hypothetical protein [Photorhabdus bodei]NDL03071.1 hypothetical protein [Photorhabdus bodei]